MCWINGGDGDNLLIVVGGCGSHTKTWSFYYISRF